MGLRHSEACCELSIVVLMVVVFCSPVLSEEDRCVKRWMIALDVDDRLSFMASMRSPRRRPLDASFAPMISKSTLRLFVKGLYTKFPAFTPSNFLNSALGNVAKWLLRLTRMLQCFRYQIPSGAQVRVLPLSILLLLLCIRGVAVSIPPIEAPASVRSGFVLFNRHPISAIPPR